MLVPSNNAILAVVLKTLDQVIKPQLSDKVARSAAQTAGHLIRFVMRRAESEGQSLFDELGVLRELLSAQRVYLDSIAHIPSATEQVAKLNELLGVPSTVEPGYVSAKMLAEHVSKLREGLYANHAFFISIRDECKDDKGYAAIRDAIRDYIVRDINEESKVIDLSFDGFGPRR